MNKINQSPYSCIHCGKNYKTRTSVEKHLMLCELLHKKSASKINIEDEDIPSQKKIYQILLELGQKYNRLEEKVDEINKWVVKKKKKINILEWLNINITPTIEFDDLINKIIIIDEDIEFLLKNSFNDTVSKIFARFLYNTNENPIFAFIQKVNTFYIYEKIEDSKSESKSEWCEISRDKLVKFMNKIQMKISKSFYQWKKIKLERNERTDIFDILCDKTTIKIMEVEFKQENTFNKLKSIMFSNMKTDLKALVEYEFEF